MVCFSLTSMQWSIAYLIVYFSCSSLISTSHSIPAFALAHALPQDSEFPGSTFQIENAVKDERQNDDGNPSNSNSLADDSSNRPSRADQEHMSIMQAIYDRLTEIENRNGNSGSDGDVDIHVFKEEVILPELEGTVTAESEVHGMIRAFRNTDTFKRAYQDLDDEEIKVEVNRILAHGEGSELGDGLNGEPNSRVEGTQVQNGPGQAVSEDDDDDETIFGRRLRSSALRRRSFSADDDDPASLCEDENCNEKVKVYKNEQFKNWADTDENKPNLTFVPKTVLGLQNIVRYAGRNEKRVRCSGHRFSWSPIFSEDGEILISLIKPKRATSTPNVAALIWTPDSGPTGPELKRIELIPGQTSQGNGLLRIGASVTNDELRRWFLKNGEWALPVNTVLADGTVIGSVSTMSHGGGREHQTLADQVRQLEYIDCNGELHFVDDPDDINAIAGSMGLFGVITHVVYEVVPMQYAILEPRKIDVALAIPPLDKEEIPEALRQGWFEAADADSRIQAAAEEFERRGADDYFSEWIWFPYQQRVWTQTWNPTTDSTGVTDYPNYLETFRQWLENWGGNAITTSEVLSGLPERWQAELVGRFGTFSLPPYARADGEPTFVAKLPNALHHRRGPANMPVRNLELEIPLPPSPNNPSQPDFSVARRAWWDVIQLVYEYTDTSPLRLGMEMRIMGGSNALLAPQRGNDLGTVSIGILSTVNAARDGQWTEFCQRVVDLWSSSTYSKDLNVRPHWAKEWSGLNMRGQPIEDYMRNVAFADQIRDFRGAMQEIGRQHGYGIEDVQARFSNPLWDQMVF